MTAEELLQFARDNAVEFVDLRHVDFAGRWHHVTVPIEEFGVAEIEHGFGRSRPSLCGHRLLVPAPATAFLDPFCQHPTLAVICETADPATGEICPDDPRGLARRAQAFLESTGMADRALFALSPEFYVFDQVSYDQSTNAAHYRVESREGAWRCGRDEPDNLGMQIRAHEGEVTLPPFDSLHNLRAEMVAALAACGVEAVGHCHGAGPGQGLLDLPPAGLVEAADRVALCKYVVRNVAARHGKVATFMPQPLHREAGSYLQLRFSLSKGGDLVLGGDKPGGLSELGLWAAGGLLKHAAGLLALHCPTTNSDGLPAWLRGGPPGTTDSHVAHSALLRLVPGGSGPAVRWIELGLGEGTCNPYLAFSGLLLAALDGIVQRVDPGPPHSRTTSGSATGFGELAPASLEETLKALSQDHAYLLKGGVFPEDALGQWITRKLGEVTEVRARPHPYEFCLYFDA